MTSPFRTFTVLAALALPLGAAAQEEIRIGVLYPLTGAAASTGIEL
jgi:branched-chain amino acid transport system substrate-binding protein